MKTPNFSVDFEEDFVHIDTQSLSVDAQNAGLVFTAINMKGHDQMIIIPWHTWDAIEGLADLARNRYDRRKP